MRTFLNSVEIICNNAGAVNVAKLLIDNGADVNARDNRTEFGETPLYSAVFFSNVHKNNEYRSSNNSFNFFLIWLDHPNAVQLLIDSGANINETYTNDEYGSTPLQLAALLGKIARQN